MVRKQAVVRGIVQAVGFRYYAQAEARRLGLAGFVRNHRDGSVEVQVEGPAASVDRMLDWLRRGPPSAQVDTVHVEDLPDRGDDGFRIE
ncbi:acylphosphatase [Cryobacterium algoricola]|uniref:acylphosphatase n=2 Tax=Cryobacterium TaxID=69578 RepID=A0AA41UJD7_9MICO|nr:MULTISPECIES: acylphosphatase [Cryobacterium]MCI4656856.1 acylphosphatase [Cryobacterium zhongshanensis]TFB84313.1 acylphosphatase [Cryobacterium algoricola]